MSSRRSLTRLFPRSWRIRYGRELADLVEDMEADERGFHLRDRLDLARAGLSERGVEFRRRGAHSPSRVVTTAAALVVILSSALFMGGVLEGQRLPSRTPPVFTATPARLVPLPIVRVAQAKVVKISVAPVMVPSKANEIKVVSFSPARLVPLPAETEQEVTAGPMKQVKL